MWLSNRSTANAKGVVAALFFTLLTPALAARQPSAGKDSLAHRLIAGKQYDEAVNELERLLKKNPRDIDLLIETGQAYTLAGKSRQGLLHCDKAIHLAPQNAATYVCRGTAYSALGQTSAALGDFKDAIARQPDQPLAYRERYKLLLRDSRFEDAIADIEQLIRLQDADAEAYFDLGYSLYFLHKPREAAARFDDAIRLTPTAGAYFYRAYARMELNQDSEALQDFEQAFKLGTGDAGAYEARGNLRLRRGEVQLARLDFDRALEAVSSENERARLGAEIQLRVDRAVLYNSSKESDPAAQIQMLGQIQNRQPESPLYASLTQAYYSAYRSANRKKEAFDAAEILNQSGRSSAETLLFAAERLFVDRRDLAKVRTYCKKAIESLKSSSQDALPDGVRNEYLHAAYYLQGAALVHEQQYKTADGLLRSATLCPTNAAVAAQTYTLLGFVNYKLSAPIEALAFYRQALKIPGNHQEEVMKRIAAIKAEYEIVE